MSLLTWISQLLSKQQSNQILGLALQQGSFTSCLMPKSQGSTANEQLELPSPSFQHNQVKLSDFANAILALQTDSLLSRQCHLVLNTQQSQMVQVAKPNVPDDEIVSALKWLVKDLVSISPDNMVLDYFDNPVVTGGKEHIHVVCAPLNELKKLVAAINQTNTEVASIVTEEFAFANLLPVQSEACLLVCQQPNEEILLLIVKQGQLYFHRRLRGYSQIAKKSEDELAMTMIDSLALEIQRSSDYFERQLKQAPIKEVKVLLPMDSERLFAQKLAENTHHPVTLLALPEAFQQHRAHAAAIGATLLKTRLAQRVKSQAQEFTNVS